MDPSLYRKQRAEIEKLLKEEEVTQELFETIEKIENILKNKEVEATQALKMAVPAPSKFDGNFSS